MGGVKDHTFYCPRHGEFTKEQAIKIHIDGSTTVYCSKCIKDFLDKNIGSFGEFKE
jgi:hypothetical protein